MTTPPRDQEEYERSAAGLDFDFPIREHAASLGARLAEGGPDAVFDQIEEILPESWREQIQTFPVAAVLLGFGIGMFLGMKKGDEILTAGSSMISAAALANVSQALNRNPPE